MSCDVGFRVSKYLWLTGTCRERLFKKGFFSEEPSSVALPSGAVCGTRWFLLPVKGLGVARPSAKGLLAVALVSAICTCNINTHDHPDVMTYDFSTVWLSSRATGMPHTLCSGMAMSGSSPGKQLISWLVIYSLTGVLTMKYIWPAQLL